VGHDIWYNPLTPLGRLSTFHVAPPSAVETTTELFMYDPKHSLIEGHTILVTHTLEGRVVTVHVAPESLVLATNVDVKPVWPTT
jgi:hypothetical protein